MAFAAGAPVDSTVAVSFGDVVRARIGWRAGACARRAGGRHRLRRGAPSPNAVRLRGLWPRASGLGGAERGHERLQGPDDAAVADLQSLAVGFICESEAYRKADK